MVPKRTMPCGHAWITKPPPATSSVRTGLDRCSLVESWRRSRLRKTSGGCRAHLTAVRVIGRSAASRWQCGPRVRARHAPRPVVAALGAQASQQSVRRPPACRDGARLEAAPLEGDFLRHRPRAKARASARTLSPASMAAGVSKPSRRLGSLTHIKDAGRANLYRKLERMLESLLERCAPHRPAIPLRIWGARRALKALSKLTQQEPGHRNDKIPAPTTSP